MLKPREAIASLEPHKSPVISRSGLNLDLNENTSGCSPRVLARIRALSVQNVSLYPEREAGEQTVARFLGLDPDQILLTNGIDEALLLLFATYLDSGAEMILADPTFVMYTVYGRALGARVVRIKSAQGMHLPTAELLAKISELTRLIAVANPNNPTGMAAPREDLLRILDAAKDAAVLVDEAYFEFGGETLLPEVSTRGNLFVARTFSKAYGLAGLRLGALVGPPEQIGYLKRFCSPFNVNGVALACLEEALADQAFVTRYIAQVREGRERLTQLCSELGLHSWPSQTNFVFARVGAGCTSFAQALGRRGVMVRDMSASPGCDGCVRITIGTPEQITDLTRAMREAMAELRP